MEQAGSQSERRTPLLSESFSGGGFRGKKTPVAAEKKLKLKKGGITIRHNADCKLSTGEVTMQIEKTMEGDIVVLNVSGQLTTATAAEFEKAVNEVLETESNLVLDFANLDFLASSGLRVILSTQKKINTKDGALVIRNVNKVVMDVFEMTGLRDFLNVFKGNRQISGS